MPKYYCKYCGYGAYDPMALVRARCPRHPMGIGKGPHDIYIGRHDKENENAAYVCKYCGRRFGNLRLLTTGFCQARVGNQKHEAL